MAVNHFVKFNLRHDVLGLMNLDLNKCYTKRNVNKYTILLHNPKLYD